MPNERTPLELAKEILAAKAICTTKAFRTCETEYVAQDDLKRVAATLIKLTKENSDLREAMAEPPTGTLLCIEELERENANLTAQLAERDKAMAAAREALEKERHAFGCPSEWQYSAEINGLVPIRPGWPADKCSCWKSHIAAAIPTPDTKTKGGA